MNNYSTSRLGAVFWCRSSPVDSAKLGIGWPQDSEEIVLSNVRASTDSGISISKASKIISMVEVIPVTRILGYRERAWADNHDVLAISRRDRLEPWA